MKGLKQNLAWNKTKKSIKYIDVTRTEIEIKL